MFKKFNFDEDIGGRSQIMSSAQRNIRTKLLQWYPGIEADLDDIMPKKEPMTQVKTKEAISFLMNSEGELLFFSHFDEQWIPSLRLVHKYPKMMTRVQVDKGAIKFVLNGADIMCPGLTSAGAIMDTPLPVGALVVITAEGKEHAIAIGKLKMSTDEIRSVNKGIAIENVHHLNDVFWKHSHLS